MKNLRTTETRMITCANASCGRQQPMPRRKNGLFPIHCSPECARRGTSNTGRVMRFGSKYSQDRRTF